MKKSERLNQELIYLSYKDHFHLKELQNEFGISERTALRDIKDLEEIGLSIYVDKGRYGAYHLTHERLWIPIRFNLEEINAIFFALKALKRMSATPFSNAYHRIYRKLMMSLPKERQSQVKEKQKYISYREQPTLHKIKYFKSLVKAVEQNLVLEIENDQYSLGKHQVQVTEIFYQTGNWFCTVYELNKNEWFILRCDKIKSCKISTVTAPKSKAWLKSDFLKYQKEFYRIPFKCELTKNGKEKVMLDLYPLMQVLEKKKKFYLEGKYNKRDFTYMVDYLIALGSDVKVISPKELKVAYINKLKEITEQY